MRALLRAAGAAVAVASAAASGFAQQAVVPHPVQPAGIVELHARHLRVLRDRAREGDGQRLASAVKELLDDLNAVKFSPKCCDYRTHYFVVVFTATDATGAPEIVPILFHAPMPDSPELPGLHGESDPRFYELVLTDPDAGVELQATYATVHEENPAEKQLADFVGTVIGKLALPTGLNSVPGQVPVVDTTEKRETPRDPVMVRFSRIVLPEPGKITSKYAVTFPNLALHLKGLAAIVNADQSARFQEMFGAVEPGPSCTAFSDQIRTVFDTSLEADPCGVWVADAGACTKRIGEDIGKAATAYFVAGGKCPPAEAVPAVQQFVGASQDVKPISATSALSNSALVRYGFGLSAGFIASIHPDARQPRAQIQSGKIVANPFSRQLAMAVVNVTPWGYDAQRQAPTVAERARFFTGPVLTPNFGLAGGFAFEINRSLALNAGYARLWFDTPKDGEKIDQPPSEANKAAPFDLKSIGAWFFGLSYNLK